MRRERLFLYKGIVIKNYIFPQIFSQSLRLFSLASNSSVGSPMGTDTVTRMLSMVISTASATGALYIFFVVLGFAVIFYSMAGNHLTSIFLPFLM